VPVILRDGCPIHFQVFGEGPPDATPLLLIHGWGCDIDSWGRLLPRLARVRRCIAVDNRGAGRSGRGRWLFGIATMADDATAVLDALGVERADVLGNSLGGMVAQVLAVRHPSRVRSLILLSSSPGLASIPSPRRLLVDLLRWVRRRSRSSGRALPRSRRRHRRPTCQLSAGLTWFGLPVLWRIRVPVLLLHGRRDSVIPPLNARLMARLIPRARLHLLPRAGHLILATHSRAVADAVTSFLDEQDARAVVTALGSSPGAPEPREHEVPEEPVATGLAVG